ncbi:MAG: hypothetical protein MK066_14090, partial [Crocinitomicaceae bacterium]|nr:hypothetical protein [Crocinitomicaceae bacterium]
MGIKIKNPCEQDWNKMTPTKHGAYCCSCELEVIDFTGKSKLEIKSILKSKLGNQVCGKIKSEQLDELNYDFLQWKNTNQKVERTWILSLIIVFGLSLFSCEEETEKKAIISIQQIGWNVNQHVAPIINQFNRIEKEKSLSLEQHKTVHSQSPDKESIERFVLGEIDYEEDHISPLLKTDTIKEEINRIMLGGIGFSPEFNKHIEEHTVPKESDLLVLMAYPNPAYEQTTLKITFPS